ncbi:MAG: ATP-binding cassette domain-containing protein [Bacteroidia bacterium]|nr:ATP-binding cassette domain-containing protein [Bacteroidia bacterium]
MNLIHFYNVLPVPLADSPVKGNVWNRNLVFFRDKHYVIQAESGRGKTTLLNIIYGTRKDFRGEVFFDETNVTGLDMNAFAGLRSHTLSYLFQDLRLFPALTAWENIEMKPGNKFTRAHVESWAEKLGVAAQLHKPCGKLSLGQQQRIAAIRALVQPFSWLLLDEPFSHLDDRNAGLMMELIQERCREEGAGILATSLGTNHRFVNFETREV